MDKPYRVDNGHKKKTVRKHAYRKMFNLSSNQRNAKSNTKNHFNLAGSKTGNSQCRQGCRETGINPVLLKARWKLTQSSWEAIWQT